MSHLEIPWEKFNFSFVFPKYYFYLHDSCSFCSQFILRVPFLSVTASAVIGLNRTDKSN